jgi:glycosyltransferase involved in cell wall biosynthesis
MTRTLSILIPCYNEARTVETLLEKIFKVELAGWRKEIIIIDDYSTDGTRDILKRYTDRTTVLLREKNGGKGSAVRAGLAHATGEYILLQDADLEYEPSDISVLLNALDRAEVVYGSRNLRPRERAGAYIPRAGVWVITKLINAFYRLSLTDVWTCYKLFPAEAAADFRSGRFESELLFTAALARRGYRFTEVPISYHPREVSEGKKIRILDGLWAIIVIVMDRLTHK